MANEPTNADICLVCGKAMGGDHAFCHVYESGRRLPLCSPACVERFECGERFANGIPGENGAGKHRNVCALLTEMIDEMRWRYSRS